MIKARVPPAEIGTPTGVSVSAGGAAKHRFHWWGWARREAGRGESFVDLIIRLEMRPGKSRLEGSPGGDLFK